MRPGAAHGPTVPIPAREADLKSELRRTGIAAVPEVRWGSHLCLFYGGQEDLLQVLVPFIVAGLEDNEVCLAVASERLPADHLLRALREARPQVDHDLQRRALQIVTTDECYTAEGHVDGAKTLAFWRRKVDAALAEGFAGLRGSGDGAWVTPDHAGDFCEMEHELDIMVAGLPVIILCPYLSSTKTAAEVLDVARTHDIVLAKRDGQWQVLETAGHSESNVQLKAARAELERRLLEERREHDALRTSVEEQTRARLRAEHVLRESEGRFANALAASPIITLITRRKDGRIIEANEAFTRVAGFERAEVVGRTPVEIGLWVEPSEREKAMEIAVTEGGLRGYEFEGRSKSGERLDLLLFAQPIEMQGEPCFIGGAIDLTAAKRAQRELRDQQWLLSESERLSHTGSWESSAAKDSIMWSDEMYRIHGKDPTRFRPSYESWMELIHPDDRAAARASLDKSVKARSAHSMEYRITLPGGETRFLRSVGYQAVRKPENEMRLVGYVTDVTQLRQAERASREALDQLKAMSRKLVELQESERRRLSRELHDRIGQNLTALSINFDMIRRRLAKDAQQDVVARMQDSATLLESTAEAVTDILAELRPPALDDLGIVPALEWHAQQFAQRTGIEVVVRGHPGEVSLSQDQQTALFRIAQEALTNVAKHASAKTVEIKFERSGSRYVLSVADDGIGTAKASNPSTVGLGLVTMRERAIAAGGDFEVSQRSAGGTIVEVRIESVRRTA